MGRPEASSARPGTLPQHPQVDLDYQLTGVLRRVSAPGAPGITLEKESWIPHLDLAVAQQLQPEASTWWKLERGPATLQLRTQLNLAHMLRPAVQPGSRIDHAWPAETVTVTLQSSQPFRITIPTRGAGQPEVRQAERTGPGSYRSLLTVTPQPNELVPIDIAMTVTDAAPDLSVHWHTAEDPTPRAFPVHRFVLPWAKLPGQAGTETPSQQRDIPELAGGNWARGREVFRSEEAACAKCHTLQGQPGGAIGPDLSNLIHRDYASVLRDIVEPSYGINPDYVTYVVDLKAGQRLVGSVRTEAGKLLVGDEKGQVTTLDREEVEHYQPTTKSIMPEGLPKVLGPAKMLDLMTFLLTEPPRMPVYPKGEPLPPRTRAELQAALAGAPEPPEKTRPIHVVLVAGKKDHGVGEHDYPAWQKVWEQLLSAARDTKVSTAWEWPQPDQFRMADVLVYFQRGSWSPEKARDIDAFLARGGGLVYIHWAVDGSPDAPSFAQRIGLAAIGGKTGYRHGPLELGFETGGKHPIARNFDRVKFIDESYWKLVGDPTRINVLANSVEEGAPRPQFWTIEPSKGRVFVSIPGHYSWTFDDPLFRILLLRGIAWTAREPVDRFNGIVEWGARIKD
jgi:putative heme-binding domain-containing protein